MVDFALERRKDFLSKAILYFPIYLIRVSITSLPFSYLHLNYFIEFSTKKLVVLFNPTSVSIIETRNLHGRYKEIQARI